MTSASNPLGNAGSSRSGAGFIRLNRSPKSFELLSADPLAFALLALIALRARWNENLLNTQGLALGEALIGDFGSAGITRQQQRTRISRLVRWGFLTSKTTNKGTIVTLLDSGVFDIFPKPSTNELTRQQPAGNQQTTGDQPLSNNGNKENKEEGCAVETSPTAASPDLFQFEAETSTGKTKKPQHSTRTPEQFLESLKSNPAYKHVDFEVEMGRIDAWLLTHPRRQKTPQFIVNWLNRIDAPLTSMPTSKTNSTQTKNGW